MLRRPPRILIALLAALLAACMAPPPAPSPTTVGVVSPTPSPSPSPSPTASPSPSPSPTPSPSPSPSPTPSPSPSPSPQSLALRLADQLQVTLDEQLTLRRIPGAAAVVTFPDGSSWSGVSGHASLNPAEPVTSDTGFVVGSITKTFVAALVLQLAEEGALELDRPLARWLPDYPRARRITLRQLLNHTSGVFNYFEHPLYESLVFGRPSHEWTPQEILDQFGRTPYFPPGSGFHYSNTGFVLLGLVVEEATGASLGEELRRRFFEPLALDHTHFQGDGAQAGWARGYLRSPSGHRNVTGSSDFRPTASAASVAWAAGGIVSTAEDIARWAEALYGGDVLNPDSLSAMTDHQFSPYPLGTYGLGTRTHLVDGARAFGHTGSLRGYMATMWRFPAEEVTVVVLTNLGRFDGNRLADALVRLALPADSEPSPGPSPTPPTSPATSPAAPPSAPSPLSPGAPSAAPSELPYEP